MLTAPCAPMPLHPIYVRTSLFPSLASSGPRLFPLPPPTHSHPSPSPPSSSLFLVTVSSLPTPHPAFPSATFPSRETFPLSLLPFFLSPRTPYLLPAPLYSALLCSALLHTAFRTAHLHSTSLCCFAPTCSPSFPSPSSCFSRPPSYTLCCLPYLCLPAHLVYFHLISSPCSFHPPYLHPLPIISIISF